MHNSGTLLGRQIGRGVGALLVNLFVLLLTIFAVFPVLWMLLSSIKEEQEFLMNIVGLPTSFKWQNYLEAIRIGKLNIAFVNSSIVSVIAVLLVVAISFVTGIMFARYTFLGKQIVYVMFLSGMLIPVHSLLIPIFIELKTFSLLNNRVALAFLYAAFGLPKAIFLITGYASTIPREIEEAVVIDGGNTQHLLFRIFLPMCSPVIGTVIILSFLDAWNEFPFALILMGKAELKTLPIALTYFTGQYSVQYTPMMAGLSIATLPIVLVYFIFHKKIMEGMVAGSVKG